MKTHMQPVGNVWQVPAARSGPWFGLWKQVRLEMDGQETELDKTIIRPFVRSRTWFATQ